MSRQSTSGRKIREWQTLTDFVKTVVVTLMHRYVGEGGQKVAQRRWQFPHNPVAKAGEMGIFRDREHLHRSRGITFKKLKYSSFATLC